MTDAVVPVGLHLLHNICFPLQFIVLSPGLDEELFNFLWSCNLAITFLRLFIFSFPYSAIFIAVENLCNAVQLII